jgi:hypothetical protein
MYLATVGLARHANHQAFRLHASHQFHRTVMADLQLFGEVADADLVAGGHTLNREQELVLLWLHSGVACRVFAESHEAPDLVAKFGQRAVIG